MEHVYDYLVFLAQTATIVVALLVVVSTIAALAMKRQQQHLGHLEIRKVNEHFQDLKYGVQEALLPASMVKKARKQEEKARKLADKAAARSVRQAEEGETPPRKRMFVIDFNGDLHASQVKNLREEITAVLTTAEDYDEVVVRLESPGGLVHGYGLAASQLDRIRQQGIPLTVIVDKVAASGGYLMAVVADRILAAPFAVVGSIGVVAQVPNVHRLLKRHDVDVEVLTAGKYKRTLTVLGENTEEARQKFIEELEEVHGLFQEFVSSHRPQVDLERVATGESWHGQHAVALNLVDELCTSDAYLLRNSDEVEIFEIRWVEHKRAIDRLMGQVESRLDAAADRWIGKLTHWRGGI
jgi:serine protease SohB